MNNIKRCLLAFSLLIGLNLFGQENPISGDLEDIYLLCNMRAGNLQLRWAPSSWQMFQAAMQSGFTLIKKSIQSDDTLIIRREFVVPAHNSFKIDSESPEDFQAAYHLLFEETENPAGILGEFSASEVSASRYGLLLYLADLNFNLAEYLKLGWTDTDYDPAQINIYEIVINSVGKSATILGGFSCIPDPLPVNNIYSYPEDHSISISWDIRHDPSRYVGFDIERSDGSDKWKKLNDRPVAIVEQGDWSEGATVIFKDTVETNDQSYFYRIRGINSFGEYGPYSRPIEAQARPRLNIGQPFITNVKNVGDTAIYLSWKPEGEDMDQIKFLVILRAEHPDSAFMAIDTIDYLRSGYSDIFPEQNNYYILQIHDLDGRIYTGPPAFGLLPDKEPPLPPEKVSALVDSLGSVVITWQPNREKDLFGYRVFYKRYVEDEIIQLTTYAIPDTVYHHTLPLDMLHDRGFYLVRAEDLVGNRSPDSELSEVILPDTISPAKPTIISTRSEIDGCILKISLSGSADVETHFVQRRNLDDTIWREVSLEIDPSIYFQQEIVDSSLEAGQEVQYRIRVNDHSGNYSLSNVVEGRRVDNKIRQAPRDPVISWDRRDKELIFSWSYPARSDLQAVRIFKSSDNSLRFYTDQYIYPYDLTIEDTDTNWKIYEYRISMPEREAGFIYKIRLDFTDGATSAPADFRFN
ncbi:MAG: fibronectin type III domain-containing protein [Saprospiraceae bacterium]|nr:fibronectin type III domain-containing protein [Saprospiraceae bacterium]